jgi:EAL and modified HD-GYP domain-containing signal transduction protein
MAAPAHERLVVGRQSIRDRAMDLVGHTLLFATLDELSTGVPSDAVLGASTAVLDRLAGDCQLWLDVDPACLMDGPPPLLPPARTVLGVQVGAEFDAPLAEACRRLAGRGYTIALHGMRWFPGAERLLESASVVSADLPLLSADERAELVAGCLPFAVRLLASGVDAAHRIGELTAEGFDLFRGFAIQHAVLDPERAIGAANPARLASAASMLGGQLDFFEIEEFLRTEPGLTYQVLRLASLGRPGETRRKVHSVREALVLVGTWRIQGWIALLLACPDTPGSGDAITTALARARACELLAGAVGEAARDGFAVGMISSFEEVLQIPAAELERTLPLADDLREAAFGERTPLARLVCDVADVQAGRRLPRRLSGLDRADLETALAAAYGWALAACAVLD